MTTYSPNEINGDCTPKAVLSYTREFMLEIGKSEPCQQKPGNLKWLLDNTNDESVILIKPARNTPSYDLIGDYDVNGDKKKRKTDAKGGDKGKGKGYEVDGKGKGEHAEGKGKGYDMDGKGKGYDIDGKGKGYDMDGKGKGFDMDGKGKGFNDGKGKGFDHDGKGKGFDHDGKGKGFDHDGKGKGFDLDGKGKGFDHDGKGKGFDLDGKGKGFDLDGKGKGFDLDGKGKGFEDGKGKGYEIDGKGKGYDIDKKGQMGEDDDKVLGKGTSEARRLENEGIASAIMAAITSKDGAVPELRKVDGETGAVDVWGKGHGFFSSSPKESMRLSPDAAEWFPHHGFPPPTPQIFGMSDMSPLITMPTPNLLPMAALSQFSHLDMSIPEAFQMPMMPEAFQIPPPPERPARLDPEATKVDLNALFATAKAHAGDLSEIPPIPEAAAHRPPFERSGTSQLKLEGAINSPIQTQQGGAKGGIGSSPSNFEMSPPNDGQNMTTLMQVLHNMMLSGSSNQKMEKPKTDWQQFSEERNGASSGKGFNPGMFNLFYPPSASGPYMDWTPPPPPESPYPGPLSRPPGFSPPGMLSRPSGPPGFPGKGGRGIFPPPGSDRMPGLDMDQQFDWPGW